MIEGWFDGVCEPRNPGGHAAFGILVKNAGVTVVSRGEYVAYGAGMSNNVAEFCGIIALFKEIEKLEGPVTIYGDSLLAINTLTGAWKVKGGLYLPYFIQARTLYEPMRSRIIALKQIPRTQNNECDELSKNVLRERGIRLRIQPGAAGSWASSRPRELRKKRSPFPKTVEELQAAGYAMRHENVECRADGCGARIDFWTTPHGKKLPVDHGTAIPHFTTCTDAERFRKGKS